MGKFACPLTRPYAHAARKWKTCMNSRFDFITVPPSQPGQTLCAAVADGLRMPRKQLPCRFFYDEAGSELFERICDLPEYYPTRTERAILTRHADAIIHAARAAEPDAPLTLIEFGSGSSCKTRLLIEAAIRQQVATTYVPIDISGDFLRASCLNLLDDYPSLSVTGLAAEYRTPCASCPTRTARACFCFWAATSATSSRMRRPRFWPDCAPECGPNDRLLIGIDLVKDRNVLEAAYNDAAGVTARFNKNLLRRINRELMADFDPDDSRTMLRSCRNTPASKCTWSANAIRPFTIEELELDFDFAAGEIVHTENSHKYTMESFARLCAPAGLRYKPAGQTKTIGSPNCC